MAWEILRLRLRLERVSQQREQELAIEHVEHYDVDIQLLGSGVVLQVSVSLQCGQSSFALALCAAANGLFTSELAPSGVGSTERAHRLIYLRGGYSESFMVTWHDRWK